MVSANSTSTDHGSPSGAAAKAVPPSTPDSEPNNVTIVSDGRLRPLRVRPPFAEYLRSLWHHRYFIQSQAVSSALSSGRGNFLGKLWIFLNPILQVAVYALIFGVILQISRGIDNFIGFLILGVIYFGFVTSGISGGSGLIQGQRNLITSFHFPKATIPVALMFRRLINNFVPAVLAIIGCILFQLDEPVHWTIIGVIPLYLLIHIFGLGTTLITARLTAFIPDTKALIGLLNRALFFLSGVFFSIERFTERPIIQEIMMANPVYRFLNAVRSMVMNGEFPTWDEWAYITAWSFGLLIVGIFYFWRAEARYAHVK